MTHFETTQREVWLTIDDGPDPVDTPRLLEILRRFEARATFFVIGERAARFGAELEAIRAAGHEIANHTARHPSATFWCLPPDPDRGGNRSMRHRDAAIFVRPLG